ncbi:hypothetical protein A2999_01480 [Candidatus Wolfebacteria bacterium RIFCSPLOWO2_01_FULL_38_11]|uniref:Cytochrome oxidase subunit II copper A binding domain-containing protein n=1 Tax=Candidatus Wolfebacteria bacterium RIFCSPLOWO2_01_FULL_38_11 TaxID=1802556 RepID=A0A1F8DUK9_9BACT|nr:MAG: hypothetical protein A2999_01480 [Candidatus Wolfebacteria bacterium RIFCSPLOWO2_01_FULL_38_11]
MNKFIIIIIFAAVLISGGVVYQIYFRAPEVAPIKATGNVVEINMTAAKNKWDPTLITVKAGDTVRLKIYNDDPYDHGFAIEVFGVNKRLFPKQETIIEFVASKKGEFVFYCSVPCGEGHFEQTGHFIVVD